MTESQQKNQEEEIFAVARVMASPEERQKYLDEVCASNTTIRKDVDELLAIYDRDHSFLESPPADLNRTASENRPPAEAPGTMIGPYKILEVIGEGGMGNVYMAEQSEPVHRKVALKIIKAGMDSKSVIARFEAERQALALMDHPNIAKFYDAGIAESGNPYFVMELIKGRPIIEFCRQHNLNLKAKLELFQQVCLGVQHAHQKGIIHRDLKPSNVLVARYDDRPVAKVIDFGVAKAVGEKLTDKTMFTRFGQLVGTLEYMSPEQSQFNQLDIDTRSDVYSLGAILYELLTGEPPFEKEKLSSAVLEEALRIIREDEPTRPSTRLSTLSEANTVEHSEGNGKPYRRDTSIPADLDWIVMKCLEKDRARRYATTNDFTKDIQRFLNNEPIEARPPSTIYRLRKFAKRKRALLTGVSLVTITFLVSVIVGSILIWNERQEAIYQRDIAQENLYEVEVQTTKAEIARADALRSQEVTDAAMSFLTTAMIGSTEPNIARNPDLTMREALDRASARVGEVFADKPLSEAIIHHFMGLAYSDLGLYKESNEHSRKAVQLHRRHLGSEHPQTLGSMDNLTIVLKNQGKYAEAQRLCEETLNLHRRVQGPEHDATRLAMDRLGTILHMRGKSSEARKIHEEVLELHRRILGPEHPDTLSTMNNLANTLGNQNETQKLYEKVLKLRHRILGREHPQTISSMNNLAIALRHQGKYVEARKLYEEALELDRRILGPEHPETLSTMNNLAIVIREQGDYARAQKLLEETLTLRQRILDPEHPDTIGTMGNLAGVLLMQSKFAKAQKLFEETLELSRRVKGAKSHFTLMTMDNLAIVLKNQGKFDEAQTLFVETLELKRSVLGPSSEDTLGTMNNLADLLRRQSKFAEARKLFEETLKLMRRVLRSEHPDTIRTMGNLAIVLAAQGESESAQKMFEEVLELSRRILGSEHPYTLGAMNNLGNVLEGQGEYARAKILFEETLKLKRRVLGLENISTLYTMDNLASLLEKQGKYAEAQKLFEVSLKLYRRILRPEHPDILDAVNNLANVLRKQGEYEEAYKVCHRVLGPEHPKTLDSMNLLAWFLATTPDQQFRDPTKAVQFAKKAIELAPQVVNYWNTLGVAHFYSRELKPAIAALKKSVQLRSGGNPNDWLFLAMAEWRLDNKDKAREWYHKSLEWMESHKTKDPDLIRFRAEAAALLGMPVLAPKPKSDKKQKPLVAPRPRSGKSK